MKEKISKSKLKKSQILNKFTGYFLKKSAMSRLQLYSKTVFSIVHGT